MRAALLLAASILIIAPAGASAPADKAEVDFDTARRLFTLVCALHARS